MFLCVNSSTVPTIPPADPLEFEHAAVAADHKLCSKVGRDILKKGGHAVDAAIATALCVGVLNPHSAGLGGGGFMIIYDRKSSKYITKIPHSGRHFTCLQLLYKTTRRQWSFSKSLVSALSARSLSHRVVFSKSL